VPQFAYIDVINPLYPRAEGPDEVRDALVRGSDFIRRERLRAADDRGFSPLRIGRPGVALGRGHDVPPGALRRPGGPGARPVG
jgi:hypothetical protein